MNTPQTDTAIANLQSELRDWQLNIDLATKHEDKAAAAKYRAYCDEAGRKLLALRGC